MNKYITRKNAEKAMKVFDGVMEVVPTVVAAASSSSPIAWLAAGASVVRKVIVSMPMKSGTEQSKIQLAGITLRARETIIKTLNAVVEPEEMLDGLDFFGTTEAERVKVYRYKDGYWTKKAGPYGNTAPLIDAIWDKFNVYELTGDGELSGVEISRYDNITPPRVTVDNTDKVVALRDAGKPIGVHLNGAYGSGKTHAAHYMARALGDRTIRVSVGKFNAQHIRDLVVSLKANTVILDDIDRSDTGSLLSLCDSLIGDHKICVIGTSNSRNNIDKAFERTGRVDIRYTYGAIEKDTLDQLCKENNASSKLRELLSEYTVATVAGFFDKMKVWDEEYTIRWLKTQQTHTQAVASCQGSAVGITSSRSDDNDDDLIDEDPV